MIKSFFVAQDINFRYAGSVRETGIVSAPLVFTIAFLALIAAAIFMLTDPLERVAERKDSQLFSTSQTIVESIEKYQGETGRLPWSDDVGSTESFAPLPWVPAYTPAVGICQAGIECTSGGELVEKKFLEESFVKDKIAYKPWKEVYVSRGSGAQDAINACFVPSSRKEREQTFALFRIDLKENPPPSKLAKCDDNVTWFEENVCWKCVSK